MEGQRYWVQLVDNMPRMGFCYFTSSRDKIESGLEKLLTRFRMFGHKVKFMRCDNAGENTKHLQEVTDKYLIQMEFTSTDTPQFNRATEKRIATIKDRGLAMM